MNWRRFRLVSWFWNVAMSVHVAANQRDFFHFHRGNQRSNPEILREVSMMHFFGRTANACDDDLFLEIIRLDCDITICCIRKKDQPTKLQIWDTPRNRNDAKLSCCRKHLPLPSELQQCAPEEAHRRRCKFSNSLLVPTKRLRENRSEKGMLQVNPTMHLFSSPTTSSASPSTRSPPASSTTTSHFHWLQTRHLFRFQR